MKTLFLDADVILDLLATRLPWYQESSRVFSLIQDGSYKGVTSVVVYTNVFYLLRKSLGQSSARNALVKLNTILGIAVTSEASLVQALNSGFTDFEDAVQYYTAQNNKVDILLTRNIKDYKLEKLAVMTPEQFIKSLSNH